MTPDAAISTGRRSPVKRDAILRAAIEVFLREGYARASVDAIAATAGVGKQTVYGHFGDKERLFLAAVDEARKAAGAGPDDLTQAIDFSGDTRADLEGVAERLLRVVLSPELSALHRLTIAEVTHHPELQHSWRDTGSEGALDAIATYLAERDQAGDLSVPDPARAARQFVLLLVADGRVRSLNGATPLTAADRRAVTRETTDLLIRACRPCGR